MLKKSDIRLLVLDVDGTLTDGKIYMGASGEMMKAFDIKDGCGIHDILPGINGGILPAIITGRESKILEQRCKELSITYLYQGVADKKEVLNQLLQSLRLEYREVAYIGDDVNDLVCMNVVKEGGGIVACPADAVEQVQEIADFVSNRRGGNGAVREFIDWLGRE